MEYIKILDPKKDNKLMFDIVKYEDDKKIFGEASIGNYNISPISKYGRTYVMLDDKNDDILSVIEVMASFNNIAYIYGVSVNYNYRRKGYAKKMLEYVISDLEKMNISIIELTVDFDNIAARKLYESFNFYEAEVLENEYGDNKKRYLMRRENKQSHYFTNSNVKSNKKLIKIKEFNQNIDIYTDNGVFSKNKFDEGSKILVDTFIKNNKKLEGNILDYGCGYGIIGILLKKIYKNINIYALDINKRAISLAIENYKLNSIDEFTIISNSDEINTKFSTILLNPPIRTGKDNVFSMYETAYNMLDEKGSLYIVIQTKHGAKSSLKKLEEIYKNVYQLDNISGYRIYKATK